MILDLSEELEDFYHDHNEELNKKNLKLLIDEFEDLGTKHKGLEPLEFKPVLNKETRVEIIDVRKHLKQKDNNLF